LIALLEYFPGKTLDDHFRHNQAALSWNVRLRIAIECASALDYLARNKVVYAQMASRNVILSQNDFTVCYQNLIIIKFKSQLQSKLCDFALISPTNEKNIRWLAPEVLKRGHFTIQSDIWAYGIFLMELFLDGMKPYSGYFRNSIISKKTNF
jgi:serine/threonine protein kinase